MKLLFPVSLVLCLLSWANGVRAQPVLEPRYAVKLAPEPLGAPAALNDLHSPEYRALRRDVRHARGMMMVGSGLLAAAAVNGAVFGPQTYCYNYEQPYSQPKTAPIASGVAAGIGIGLLIGGGIKLAHLPEGYRRILPVSGGRAALLVLGAITSAAAASGLLALISAPEMIHCSG